MTIREKTNFIVIHCSATRPSMNWGAKEIRHEHVDVNGWSDIGYHYIIKRDGSVEPGRAQNVVGAHVAGYNSVSVGVCLIGGVSEHDIKIAEDNFTDAQKKTLIDMIHKLKKDYPNAKVLGHRDLSPDKNHDGVISSSEWIKECPSFDVADFLKRNHV